MSPRFLVARTVDRPSFLVAKTVVCPLCLVCTRPLTDLRMSVGGLTVPSLIWPMWTFYPLAVLLRIFCNRVPTELCEASARLRLTDLTIPCRAAIASRLTVTRQPETLQDVDPGLAIRKQTIELTSMIRPLRATIGRGGKEIIRLCRLTCGPSWLTKGTTTDRFVPRAWRQ